MNDFERDNAWQKTVRDTVLGPGFYGRYSLNGRYVHMDKGRLASILQRRYAVDTVVQKRNGDAACIEEKIVRWKGRHYSAFCLETHSCTVPGRESPGWMEYGKCDLLLYAFQQPDESLDTYLIDFPELQHWFWQLPEDEFPRFGPLDTLNKSMGRNVPIERVRAVCRTWRIKVEKGHTNGEK